MSGEGAARCTHSNSLAGVIGLLDSLCLDCGEWVEGLEPAEVVLDLDGFSRCECNDCKGIYVWCAE